VTSPAEKPQRRTLPYLRQMREQGYTDGWAGREKRWPQETEYLRCYRRGREARERDLA